MSRELTADFRRVFLARVVATSPVMNIRATIRDALGKAGLSARELSQRLGRKHSYISDFLNKGSPVDLSYEDKLMVANVLDLNPEILGIKRIVEPPRIPGLSEDAVAWSLPPGHYLRASPHLAYFRLKGRCLDQHPLRLMPGMLLAFDLNKSSVNDIPSGSIVIAQLYDKRNLTGPTTTVIRQFIAPNKLITNSSVANEIISLDDPTLPFDPVIKGTLRSSISADE